MMQIINGHIAKWECAQIIKIFLHRNFIVDVIDYSTEFIPKVNYDFVLDIHSNLQAIAPFVSKNVLNYYM